MIDKFFEEFDKFTSHDKIPDITDEAIVQLFGIYIQLRTTKPINPPQPSGKEPKTAVKIRRPDNPATFKQKKLLDRLIKQGQVDSNTDLNALTVSEASALIDAGIQSPKKTKAPAPTPPVSRPAPEDEADEPEFTGAYSHQSGNLESENLF